MKKQTSGNTVKRKLLGAGALCLVLLTLAFAACLSGRLAREREAANNGNGEQIVRLNEIRSLLSEDADPAARERLDGMIRELQAAPAAKNESAVRWLTAFYAFCVLLLAGIFFFVYRYVLRPFDRLERFAGEIAAGNLDGELPVERIDLFGQFTWAFDHMRRELRKARRCEAEAIENNKTVIATLSHDIKTPIASIRAYAEGLQENLDRTPERRERYLQVILRKCDEVAKITNDLFLHSLHDLERLTIKKEPVVIHELLRETVVSMQGGSGDLRLREPLCEAELADVDAGRIAQAIENLIHNARKYAPGSPVDIWTEQGRGYEIHIRDHGQGIPPEDMPFVFDKFYRGHNCQAAEGAGLGLFIVRYVMERMNGEVRLYNHADGLEAVLAFGS
ncbi:MAG: HAMP domain-containing sensor histidine kinase [Lachnospiraceae bacterium]|nr:HAMP domain-containing sensor histidine kinase [Lachnospiraceae bacterium]